MQHNGIPPRKPSRVCVFSLTRGSSAGPRSWSGFCKGKATELISTISSIHMLLLQSVKTWTELFLSDSVNSMNPFSLPANSGTSQWIPIEPWAAGRLLLIAVGIQSKHCPFAYKCFGQLVPHNSIPIVSLRCLSLPGICWTIVNWSSGCFIMR